MSYESYIMEGSGVHDETWGEFEVFLIDEEGERESYDHPHYSTIDDPGRALDIYDEAVEEWGEDFDIVLTFAEEVGRDSYNLPNSFLVHLRKDWLFERNFDTMGEEKSLEGPVIPQAALDFVARAREIVEKGGERNRRYDPAIFRISPELADERFGKHR